MAYTFVSQAQEWDGFTANSQAQQELETLFLRTVDTNAINKLNDKIEVGINNF